MTIGRVAILMFIITNTLVGVDRILAQSTTDVPQTFSLKPVPGDRADMYLFGQVETLGRFAGESRHEVGSSVDSDGEEFPVLVAGQLGLMKNLRAGHAVGIAIYFGASGDSWRMGLAPRYSHWVGKQAEVSVAPVILVAGGNSKSDVSYPAFGGQVGLMVTSWLGFTLRTEIIDHTSNQDYQGAPAGIPWTEKSWYGGLSLGGYPGIVVAGTAVLLLGLASAAAQSL